MRTRKATEFTKGLLIALALITNLGTSAIAHSRTLETRFGLSADRGSEFSTRFPVLSAGRIVVEANWRSSGPRAVNLKLLLLQPDGVPVTTKAGKSTLTLEHRVLDSDVQGVFGDRESRWSVKIINDGEDRSEVTGTLRITVPVVSRTLEDTQFTLLGSGNAQEIPFNVPAAGRIDVEVNWQPDVLESPQDTIPLLTSLIHPGEDRIYVKRQGASPIRVEQQVTELILDRGSRWIVRVQNDSQTKVKGRLKVTYTPSL